MTFVDELFGIPFNMVKALNIKTGKWAPGERAALIEQHTGVHQWRSRPIDRRFGLTYDIKPLPAPLPLPTPPSPSDLTPGPPKPQPKPGPIDQRKGQQWGGSGLIGI